MPRRKVLVTVHGADGRRVSDADEQNATQRARQGGAQAACCCSVGSAHLTDCLRRVSDSGNYMHRHAVLSNNRVLRVVITHVRRGCRQGEVKVTSRPRTSSSGSSGCPTTRTRGRAWCSCETTSLRARRPMGL